MKQAKTLAALAATLFIAGGAFAQVTSGTGATVTSGTGVSVSQGAAPAAVVSTPAGTAVMGIGPAPTTISTTTLRTWPQMPPNVEARRDFQRWMKLK